MPIEGPLKELGLPDVFQLLDLSRKTGLLRVSSRSLDDEAIVYFEEGRVVQASLRSRPPAPAESAPLTPRELERKIRAHIEAVVFHVMNWREGFFSFEEQPLPEVPGDGRAAIATESLLMESARRIDEWSRIADKIPHLMVIPALAEMPEEHETLLDLLPHEWEVLGLIDGQRDLRDIATALGRGEFEAAKVVYGLVTTGVVEIATPVVDRPDSRPRPAADPEEEAALERGFAAVRAGDFATARENLERFLARAPGSPEAPRARAALSALSTLIRALDRGAE